MFTPQTQTQTTSKHIHTMSLPQPCSVILDWCHHVVYIWACMSMVPKRNIAKTAYVAKLWQTCCGVDTFINSNGMFPICMVARYAQDRKNHKKLDLLLNIWKTDPSWGKVVVTERSKLVWIEHTPFRLSSIASTSADHLWIWVPNRFFIQQWDVLGATVVACFSSIDKHVTWGWTKLDNVGLLLHACSDRFCFMSATIANHAVRNMLGLDALCRGLVFEVCWNT